MAGGEIRGCCDFRVWTGAMVVVVNAKPASLAALVFLALSSAYGYAQNPVGSPEVRPELPSSALQATPVAARSSSSPQDLLIGAGDMLEESLYGLHDFKTTVHLCSAGYNSFPSLSSL